MTGRWEGFTLDPGIDADTLSAEFTLRRRVQVTPFLTGADAARLRQHLVGRKDWKLVLNAGDKVFEMDRDAQATLTAEQRAELDRKVAAESRRNFQFRFETIRVPDEPAARLSATSLLDRFALFMSSPAVLEMVRRITGAADIGFADAQATSYGHGHFLTSHNDDVEGKSRRLAYVLSLTDCWRAEWGGVLLFHGPTGDIERGLVPRFNSLNIFGVPQQHSVSYVTPAAPEPRISVTGWMRRTSGG